MNGRYRTPGLPANWSIIPGGTEAQAETIALPTSAPDHALPRRGTPAQERTQVSNAPNGSGTAAAIMALPKQAPGGIIVQPGLYSYRPLAALAAGLLLTPLDWLIYLVLFPALVAAGRQARSEGWPFIPGRLALWIVLGVAGAHHAALLLAGTPIGRVLAAHIPWLWCLPLPSPGTFLHALSVMVHAHMG